MFLFVLPLWFAAFLAFLKISLDWREAVLSACVIWGVIVLVLTEALSIFQELSFVSLALAWALISCASLIISARLRRSRSLPKQRAAFEREQLIPAVLIVGTCSIFLVTFVVALIAPPNNWDSMTYHMARVVNWADHRSVRHYPTHIIRQLYLGPWAEFAITHLQILWGGDRLANLVQFVSMLGSAVGASLVAKKLGAGSDGQSFAFVYSATVPIGVLQASSTQNDYASAFWLLCFLNFHVDLVATPSLSWRKTLLAAASLGLAMLTKITTLIFAAPFLLWMSVILARSQRARSILLLGIVAGTTIVINAGHCTRNARAFGSVLGPELETGISKNEIHTFAAISSNVIRNVAAELVLPRGNRYIGAAVYRIHSLTGLDISDTRITHPGEVFRFPYSNDLDENSAGNVFHLLVAAGTVILAFWLWSQNRIAAIYSGCLLAGFWLFCGCVRWQPWISRLHLPLFVAVAPICGWVLSRPRLRRIGYAASAIALLIGLVYSIRNHSRPLFGNSSVLTQTRTYMYFANRPKLRGPFFAAAYEIARENPRTVGLVSQEDDWEYPLRLLVRNRLGTAVQFEHVNVQNESRNCQPEIASDPGLPETLVVIGTFLPGSVPSGYKVVFASDSICVLRR